MKQAHIFTEYNRMNETKIQSKCENDLEMRNMITTIRSLESSETEKEKINQELEGENHVLVEALITQQSSLIDRTLYQSDRAYIKV